MVLPYGGTFRSNLEYVRLAVRERTGLGQPNPFEGDAFKDASLFLAQIVWEAIGQVVIKAREAMKWLQQMAGAATKAELGLRWVAPSGFVVRQAYQAQNKRRVKTAFSGVRVELEVAEEGRGLDAAKQRNSVSPNFVHSLDATALVLTVCACVDGGLTDFAMIHDSYGTHAALTDTLAQTLRAEFVRMYAEHDVLQEFKEGLEHRDFGLELEELPEIPERGALDILEVLASAYFFA